MQVRKPVAVEPLLHPGNALVIDVDEPDQVRNLPPAWIDAFVLAQEADSRNSETMNFLLLRRGNFAFQPDKTLTGAKTLSNLGGLEIWQRRRQQLDRLVPVDDASRFAKQARRLDIGGKSLAVTIEDIGPRRGDRVLRGGTVSSPVVRKCCKHDETRCDYRID